MSRSSNHVEPRGAMATVRHYLRDLVYGANDGIITTFAVVAGVAGGSLSPTAVLIIGTANLAADGLSMAVGNFLAIRANERARAVDDLPEEEAHPEKHAAATMMAFIGAGAVPLAPYVLPQLGPGQFAWSCGLTAATLFSVGAARGVITLDRWWEAGAEMLALGLVVAAAAYGAGYLVASLVT